MTPVIIDAWRAGSRFDAWVEHFSLDNWKEAAAKNGIDLNELVHLPYELDWRLPWEHVSPGCTRGFLEREYRRSLEGVTTPTAPARRAPAAESAPRSTPRTY